MPILSLTYPLYGLWQRPCFVSCIWKGDKYGKKTPPRIPGSIRGVSFEFWVSGKSFTLRNPVERPARGRAVVSWLSPLLQEPLFELDSGSSRQLRDVRNDEGFPPD